jgi:hypothetical protein
LLCAKGWTVNTRTRKIFHLAVVLVYLSGRGLLFAKGWTVNTRTRKIFT